MPLELDDVILRALERDLGKRFQSANELRRALELFLSSRTTAPIFSQLQSFMVEQVGSERIRLRSAPTASPKPGSGSPLDTGIAPLSEIDDAPPPTLAAPASEVRPVEPVEPVAPPRSAGQRGMGVGLGAGGLLILVAAALAIARPWQGSDPAAPVVPVAPPPATPLVPSASTHEASPVAPPATTAVEPATPNAPADTVVDQPVPVVGPPLKPKGPPTKRPAPTQPATKPVPELGFLDVNCVPWCRVVVDDKEAVDSPVQGMKLSPGRHRVRVVNPPSGMSREREVTVKANETAKELIRF